MRLDDVGELLIRGPNVAAGYWNDPVRTADTFVDGWLHTGDIARIDDGIVRIVDRAKDMIDRGGENVYSVEVENVLAAHPDVLEVAVVGVPDPVMGEKVGAVVVPRPGVSAETLAEDLVAWASDQLADFKLPEFVRVLDRPLPRNAGGKLLKAPLRAAGGWSTVRRAPSRPMTAVDGRAEVAGGVRVAGELPQQGLQEEPVEHGVRGRRRQVERHPGELGVARQHPPDHPFQAQVDLGDVGPEGLLEHRLAAQVVPEPVQRRLLDEGLGQLVEEAGGELGRGVDAVATTWS